jgi:hypothetical protein
MSADPITAQVARWTDSRAAHKAKAAAELATIKRQALWAAAHKSMTVAIETGTPRYRGRICARNPAHGGERYVSGGGCCECARLGAERKRRERGAPVKGPRPQSRHPLRSARRAAARSRRAEGSGAGRSALQ